MRVVVVYKWARNPEDAAVRGDGSVDWRGARMTPGEDDPAAVAVARAVASAADADLVGLTIGDGDASWALARGVAHVVSISDAPLFPDNAATAGLLAAAVRRIGDVEVVVIGDAESSAGVPTALAGHLGWPVLAGTSTVALEGGRVLATRRVEGSDQTVSAGLPVVLAVAATSAEKQGPGMREVLAARRRPVTQVSWVDLEADGNQRLESRGTRVPAVGTARILQGSPAETATELVAVLRRDGVL